MGGWAGAFRGIAESVGSFEEAKARQRERTSEERERELRELQLAQQMHEATQQQQRLDKARTDFASDMQQVLSDPKYDTQDKHIAALAQRYAAIDPEKAEGLWADWLTRKVQTSVYEGRPEPDPADPENPLAQRVPLIDRYSGRILSFRSVAVKAPAGAKPKILQPSGGGPPYGIQRGEEIRLPGRPGWTEDDQAELTAAINSWKEGQAESLDKAQKINETRAKAWASTRAYGVIDAGGNLVMATASQIAGSPGQYAPAGAGVTARNRSAIFGEIDYTSKKFDEAIDKLGDEGFDAGARAQLALVLSAYDPRSALSTFFQSSAATTLSPEQIDYVTGLVSLQESALSLRTVAGMGQGSDMLRGAIVNMLPGAGTPSRPFAKRQMELFRGEVDALRRSVPGLPGSQVVGGGGGARYIEAGQYARDPQGVLHRAKKRTPLPEGWTIINAATAPAR